MIQTEQSCLFRAENYQVTGHSERERLTNTTIMVLGRMAHYAFDAILLSTVIAGIKKSSGFA